MDNKKQILVWGGLGISERRDRDPDRVLDTHGIIYTLPAHIDKDKPLILVKRHEQ